MFKKKKSPYNYVKSFKQHQLQVMQLEFLFLVILDYETSDV